MKSRVPPYCTYSESVLFGTSATLTKIADQMLTDCTLRDGLEATSQHEKQLKNTRNYGFSSLTL